MGRWDMTKQEHINRVSKFMYQENVCINRNHFREFSNEVSLLPSGYVLLIYFHFKEVTVFKN